jgi:hypothetical protein
MGASAAPVGGETRQQRRACTAIDGNEHLPWSKRAIGLRRLRDKLEKIRHLEDMQ